MRMNYTRDKKRVDYFEQAARAAAGLSAQKKESADGTSTPTGNAARRRKVKVPMVQGSDFSGHLELIVEGEQVFVVSLPISVESISADHRSRMMMARSNHCRVSLPAHRTSARGHSRSRSRLPDA